MKFFTNIFLQIWKNYYIIVDFNSLYFLVKSQKIVNSVIISLLFIVFSFFYWEEYYNFHKNKIEITKAEENFQKEAKSFKIEDIKKVENIDIIATPNKELLKEIVNIIDNAKNYVYVEVYMLTESRIKEAILRAKKRWVDIQVILEKDPYLAYNINNKTFDEFQKEWINIIWSNQKNYTLNHSKIILVDGLSIISTGNLTYSSFTQNRDIYVFTKDQNIHKSLLEVFKLDYSWIKKWVLYENLVLSPQNSRDKIEKLFGVATKEIKIYIPYFDDEWMLEKLISLKKEKNLEIIAIIPKTAVDDENTRKLIKAWLEIYQIPKYTMHSKAILVDDMYLWIWSTNFSEYSLNQNREIGILLKEEKVIEKFKGIFEEDII